MDFHGNINLKDNEMQNMVFQQESSFPVDAVVGSVVFNDTVLYMAVAIGNDSQPVWIPLTSTIDTYVFDQESASATWNITHSLGADNPVVQIYDDNQEMIIPDEVTITDASSLVVTFGTSISGRAIIMSGDQIPANGVGIIEPNLNNAFNDISTMSFSSVIDISIPPFSTAAVGTMILDQSGTRMFMSNDATNILSKYTLSTPYDITTATETQSLQLAMSTSPRSACAFISPDGTKYISRRGNQSTIISYTLTTPYDITTFTNTATLATDDGNMRGLEFSPDGFNMYVGGNNSKRIYQYTLATAFHVNSSTGFTNITLAEFAGKTIGSLSMNGDGTKMQVLRPEDDQLLQYSFGTPYDITTLTYDGILLNLNNPSFNTPYGAWIPLDGEKLYIYSSVNDSIEVYTI